MKSSMSINATLKDYSMSNAKKMYTQALLCEETGDLEEAIGFYNSAIELEPSFVKSYQNLGSIYSKLGNHKQAYELFQKAVQISPNSETFFNLAVEEYKTDKIDNAVVNLKKSLEFDKRYLNSHLLLASAYEKSGKNEKTQLYLNNAYKIDPKNKMVLSARIFFHYERGHVAECLKLVEEYTSLFPDDARFIILKSELLSQEGNYSKSIEALTELSKKNSDFKENILKEKNSALPESKKHFQNVEKKAKEKLKEFKTKMELSKENPEDFSGPNSQDAFDLSILHLFNGEPEKAMKYLVYAQKVNRESKED